MPSRITVASAAVTKERNMTKCKLEAESLENLADTKSQCLKAQVENSEKGKIAKVRWVKKLFTFFHFHNSLKTKNENEFICFIFQYIWNLFKNTFRMHLHANSNISYIEYFWTVRAILTFEHLNKDLTFKIRPA